MHLFNINYYSTNISNETLVNPEQFVFNLAKEKLFDYHINFKKIGKDYSLTKINGKNKKPWLYHGFCFYYSKISATSSKGVIALLSMPLIYAMSVP